MKVWITTILMTGLIISSPASSQILHGVIAHAQHLNLPDCTLIAEDAFSFNSVTSCGINCDSFDNDSPAHKGVSGMSCNLDGTFGFVKCPTLLPNGGPDGNGGLYIGSGLGQSWSAVGLDMADKPWQDYSIANEVSVAFHFKARLGPSPFLYGWWQSPVLHKTGEIFTGVDNNGDVEPHGDRICINVDGVLDAGGPTGTGTEFCGTNSVATNNGLGPTTGADSTPVDEWIHYAGVFDGTNGEYRTYLNGELVNTETGITGEIANTTGRWTIGVGVASFAFTDYEIDNLQLDDTAWDLARVLQADCNVPD